MSLFPQINCTISPQGIYLCSSDGKILRCGSGKQNNEIVILIIPGKDVYCCGNSQLQLCVGQVNALYCSADIVF